MRAYVSGGMTGWPNNNREAFDAAAEWLRRMGHDVVTPIDLDEAQGVQLDGDGFDSDDEEYEGFLERDLDLLANGKFDAIVFIQGWQTSGGAGREGRKAIEEGLDLHVWNPSWGGWLMRISPKEFLKRSRTERLRKEEVT